jgi:hypothetical protein
MKAVMIFMPLLPLALSFYNASMLVDEPGIMISLADKGVDKIVNNNFK